MKKTAKRAIEFVIKHKISILLITVIFGFLLRFYNYSNRWGLGADDGRDLMIAHQLLIHRRLPMFGFFQSAGPFVIGPLFYYFIMLVDIIFPFAISSPYAAVGILNTLSIAVYYFVGKEIADKKLGILLAFLAAISPQLTIHALALSNPSMVPIFTICFIYFFILLWKTGKRIFALLMGIMLGIILNMHYSTINLFFFLPFVLLVPKTSFKQKIIFLLLIVSAFFACTLPLLLWDSQQSFANTRNILDYFLIGQYRQYVPNSWKIFLFQFYPYFWSFVIGGESSVGIILMGSFVLGVVVALWKKKISSVMVALLSIFALLSLLNRYYHGIRTEGYFLYLNPIILMLTGWSLYILSQVKLKKIYIGYIVVAALLILITIGSAISLRSLLGYNNGVSQVIQTMNLLQKQYPGKKFAVYDYQWETPDHSYALSSYLGFYHLIDENGIPIGVMRQDVAHDLHLVPLSIMRGTAVASLQGQKNIAEPVWSRADEIERYSGYLYWNDGHHLKSTFSLTDFIKAKLKRG